VREILIGGPVEIAGATPALQPAARLGTPASSYSVSCH